MSTVLVTGATGLLGSSLVPYLKENGYNVKTHGFSCNADFMLDLSDEAKATNMLDHLEPDFIINLVSMTSVEDCEDQINLAYLTNTKSVQNIANWLKNSNKRCHLIHISTDHVYDGDGINLNSENDIKITNNYAFSKYAGELVLSDNPCTILRTNFVGKSMVNHRESLTDWVFDNSKSKTNVNVLTDVYFNPLSIKHLCEMLNLVIKRKPMGCFNLGSHNGMSKADFDIAFADTLGLSTKNMKKISISEATFFKACRPKDMRMDISKFERELDIKLPSLTDIIKEVAGEYE
tara:strand:+ start:1737 stop:2609 length:873 start_codon:yes stop_codon:yes gene_type:complete